MRISLPSCVLNVLSWRVEKELIAHIGKCKKQIVLGNRMPDVKMVSLSISTALVGDESDFEIALFFTDTGFEPQVMVLEKAKLMTIGFEDQLVGIDIDTSKVKFQLQLETDFRGMKSLDHRGILVFEEIGVSVMSLNGEKIWSFLKDVVTGAELQDSQYLYLSFMDSPSVRVNIESGVVSVTT